MAEFFIDVICYPITFPIGMITNYIYPLDFCFDINNRETNIKGDDSKVNVDQKDTSDSLISGTQLNVLNQEFNDIMLNNSQSTTIKEVVDQKVVIECDFTDIEESKLTYRMTHRIPYHST